MVYHRRYHNTAFNYFLHCIKNTNGCAYNMSGIIIHLGIRSKTFNIRRRIIITQFQAMIDSYHVSFKLNLEPCWLQNAKYTNCYRKTKTRQISYGLQFTICYDSNVHWYCMLYQCVSLTNEQAKQCGQQQQHTIVASMFKVCGAYCPKHQRALCMLPEYCT